MIRNTPRGATIYGIDLGKNIFHVVGTDPAGDVVQRVKFRRDTLLVFFERAKQALAGMEACPRLAMAGEIAASDGTHRPDHSGQLVKPYCKVE